MGDIAARLMGVAAEFARRTGTNGPIRVLDGFDLDLVAGSTTCLLGPSGSGKSTVLGLFAGFIRPAAGRVEIGDRINPPPGRDRGVVFQRHSLFPWMTVRDNLEFGLRSARVPRARRRELAREIAAQIGLADVLDDYPRSLSGGMEQRVGLGRVLINEPSLLLLDEPFSSLDALTAEQTRLVMMGVLKRRPTTALLVTHDIDEALEVGDRIVVMGGRPATPVLDLRVDLERGQTRRDDPGWPGLRRSIVASLVKADSTRPAGPDTEGHTR